MGFTPCPPMLRRKSLAAKKTKDDYVTEACSTDYAGGNESTPLGGGHDLQLNGVNYATSGCRTQVVLSLPFVTP